MRSRVVLALLVAATLVGCTSTRHPAPAGGPAPGGLASGGLAVDVTRGACGGAWRASGGEVTFEVRNTDIVTTDVSLVDPATGGVYAEVESLAPNTARPMRLALGHHDYALRCYPDDAPMLTGPTVSVTTGPSGGDPAVIPVDDVDLDPAVRTYRAAVAARLGTLAADAAALDAATRRGDRAAAESAWLAAHLAYGRLGAAYSAALCGSVGVAGGFADRCGYGPRLPLLVISPWAKRNYVDHTRTDQSSVLRFIETNWLTGRVGGTSFDTRAGSLFGMLNFFQAPKVRPVVLDPTTGAVVHH